MGQSQDIRIQESSYRDKIEAFLNQMAGIIEDKMADQAETEELVMELSQSFEDLNLYSRIKTHGSTLQFTETMLKNLVEELRGAMRAELAFAIMPELKQYDAVIYDEELKDRIPDVNAFAKKLIDTILRDAPSLAEHYFIINDSRQSEEYRPLHSDPYRFLAVAIQQDDKFFGWLGMVSFNMKEIFRNSEMLLLKSLASSTAAAFENASLYAESLRMAEKERFVRNVFQKYVPEEVANEMLNLGERDLIKLGEKKLLTLLNVDIRGYSKMSKKVRAEDMVEVLNYFFMVMGTVILKHKGMLDKYLGDGLLAIFGAPVTFPNPALDATLAAMEMVENLETANKYAKDRCGMPLKIGISINTGEAIVGNIGFEKKMDYTVIGDVVNDTFRLQDLTREKSNSIYISETTYLLVKSIIQTRSLGLRTLESNENEMVVYEVTDKRKASDLRAAEPQ
jgi:class 3 adenylate cyclase